MENGGYDPWGCGREGYTGEVRREINNAPMTLKTGGKCIISKSQ